MPAVITGAKELAIRDKLVEIYQDASDDFFVFDKSRFIKSKSHFEANTTKQSVDSGEIRYTQLSFKGFAKLEEAMQFDAECVPITIRYELEVFAQHFGTRSDDSNTETDFISYLGVLWNATLDNNELLVDGVYHALNEMVLTEDKVDIEHEVMEVDGYRTRYEITVEVRA